MKIIEELFDIITKLKGFNAGYASASPDKLIIEYEGKPYFVKVVPAPKNLSIGIDRLKIFNALNEWNGEDL